MQKIYKKYNSKKGTIICKIRHELVEKKLLTSKNYKKHCETLYFLIKNDCKQLKTLPSTKSAIPRHNCIWQRHQVDSNYWSFPLTLIVALPTKPQSLCTSFELHELSGLLYLFLTLYPLRINWNGLRSKSREYLCIT